jgi:hypothetical protein
MRLCFAKKMCGPHIWERDVMRNSGIRDGENFAVNRLWMWFCGLLLAMALLAIPASAQDLETFDPDEAYGSAQPAQPVDNGAIDADLGNLDAHSSSDFRQAPPLYPATSDTDGTVTGPAASAPAPEPDAEQWATPEPGDQTPQVQQANGTTYAQDDLIGAAEGVFGKGAKGLTGLIEDLLRKQGEPNGYIVGREAGGAFVVGARYGSGTLHHKVEGERPVYWTGPSVGIDAGANAGSTFVLVYNLYDSEDIFRRYPAGEGQAYFVGGLHASYMRRGDVVLIPIRMGAGLRLGVNAGYMRFSKKQRWLPF